LHLVVLKIMPIGTIKLLYAHFVLDHHISGKGMLTQQDVLTNFIGTLVPVVSYLSMEGLKNLRLMQKRMKSVSI